MEKIESKLTVYFEDPFWVGVYERSSGGKLEACKITFGAEPKDCEVYDFLLRNWGKLRFGPPIKTEAGRDVKLNPKRMQREAKKQLETHGAGTKSQQAIALAREENKLARKEGRRRQKEDERARQFALRQQKRKEKHRGR